MDEIKITKWSGLASAGHEVFNVQRAPNGTWVSAATNEVLDLGVALHVTPDGALWIETLDGESPLDEILRHLPRGHGYSGWAYDRSLPETGIDAIDSLEDDGGIPVFVDGQRIGLVRVREAAEVADHWFICDAADSADGRARPKLARTIAQCAGVQTNSMTSGTSFWSVGELPDGRIAFTFDEDEEPFWLDVTLRAGRSDSELVDDLADRAWVPAGLGLRVAVEQGRAIKDEYLNDLIDGDFNGIVVSAEVWALSSGPADKAPSVDA